MKLENAALPNIYKSTLHINPFLCKAKILTDWYRKKYFSSKERLCITQQTAVESRKKQHGKLGSWFSSTSTVDLQSARPSTSAGLHSLKPKSRAHDPKLFLIRFDEDSISEQEAHWFLSLPEKVKSKRFSREELVSLTAISHRVLSKSAEKSRPTATQRRQSVHRLETSACVPIGSALSSAAASTTEESSLETPSAGTVAPQQAPTSASQQTRIPIDVFEISKIRNGVHGKLPVETDQAMVTAVDAADAEMEILKLYLQRRSIKSRESASKNKQSPPSSPPTGLSQPTKRNSNHRLHMLTPLPLPPPVLAPASTLQTSAEFTASARLSRPFFNTDPLVLEIDSFIYVQEPGEGSRVLEPAAAPALLIECEVFELPANEDPAPISPDEECPYPRLVSAFSDDDTEDDGNEEDDNADAESVETGGPRTPSPMDHADGAATQAAGDSGVEIPELNLTSRPKTASVIDRTSTSLSNYASTPNSIGSKPQVLRTSSEEILYAYQRRLTSGVDVETSNPLALSTLPVCDDDTGAHGAFAVSRSLDSSSLAPTKGLKRVFKSFRRL